MTTTTEARRLARSLMNQHGLHRWEFDFDNARKRAGQCRGDDRTITLSRYFVTHNEIERVRITILHEIAHALVGTQHGHDRVWKRKCLEIGGNGQRCTNAEMPPTPWQGVCPTCSKTYGRIRRPSGIYICVPCHRLGRREPIVWKRLVSA